MFLQIMLELTGRLRYKHPRVSQLYERRLFMRINAAQDT